MISEQPDSQNILPILVIEDDIDDFYIVKELLQKDAINSYSLTHVSRLSDAITYIDTHHIQLILLDLNLEDSEGLETLETLITRTNEVPIVILTGLNEELIGRKAIQLGATDYVPKAQLSPYLLSRSIGYGIERHNLISELNRRANEDSLTGLPNRASLFRYLSVVTEQVNRNRAKLAIGMVDLDGFKQINDKCGHVAGDKLLIQVASRLNDHLRKSDYAARLAGDEFVILVGNYKNNDELLLVLDKVRQAVDTPFTLDLKEGSVTVKISCSIGVVEWKPSYTIENFISQADTQMYESKKQGKNRISFVDLT